MTIIGAILTFLPFLFIVFCRNRLRATALARDMVTRYGMSDKFGPIALEGNAGRTIFGQGVDDREYSEKVGDEIDGEVSRMMEEAHTRAKDILTENRVVLDRIAKKLMEVETLEREEYEKLLEANGIEVKKKSE